MSDIPARLAALREAAPAHLMPEVLAHTGLADRYAARPSALGPVFVAFTGPGSRWWTWQQTRPASWPPTGGVSAATWSPPRRCRFAWQPPWTGPWPRRAAPAACRSTCLV